VGIVRAVCVALVSVWVAQAALAAEPSPDEIRKQFQETIAASRLPIEVRDGRLSGPGAAFVQAHADEAQFVLLGEEHGVATIADTVRMVFADLNPRGYRHFAIEVDPWMTARLEATLRAGGMKALVAFLRREEAKLSIPFYNWSSEAALAAAVVRANGDATPALWGLDQLFIGAAGVLLGDVAAQASNVEARTLAQALAGRAKGNLQFLGEVDLGELQKLRSLLEAESDRALAELVDGMILSGRIYQPFVTGKGLSVYAANLERENLMKRLFLARFKEAEMRDGTSPKVLFKFGANHVMRGLSTTHVPSLGNFVADFALARGAQTFSVLLLCGPGTKAGDFQGNEGDCAYSVPAAFPDLVAHVDAKQPTLFDLRVWKDKPRRWAHLSPDVRELIWAYDAVLFVPNGKPAKALK
jgi:hypothetical protein